MKEGTDGGTRSQEHSSGAGLLRELRGIRMALEALTAPKVQAIDRDSQAVALMLTMDDPTKGKISRALGYSHVSALKRLPKFCAAWDQFSIMRTVTAGNGRSIVRADGADDFDDE